MKKDSVLVKFGNKVRQLRNEKGWSQEELSFKSGFHRTYIGTKYFFEEYSKNSKNIQCRNTRFIH